MSVPVAVSAFAVWTPAGVFIDTTPEAGAPDAPLAAWPDGPVLAQVHPRARRPHAHAVSLVRLAHQLLSERERAAPPALRLIPRDEVELSLGTVAGSASADLEFVEGLRQRGVAFGSPSTFVYTLPTAAPAEVALALGLRGALTTVTAGAVSGLSAVARAAARIASGSARACLCGGVELARVGERWAGPGTGHEAVALFLLEAVDASSPWPRVEAWGLGFGEAASTGTDTLLEVARAVARAREQGGAQAVVGSSPEGAWARLQVAPSPSRGP
ncbi:hypothetical protein KRR26_06385 [Corallococcus sp. M34]|uniref:beta-ketoacyl synthase N-terminal-like domain-containing protein n=1 Tax=Citreicoccus inhibens TaxID=2849499 RepID=UPI001C24AC0A|nr:beta-ketoacyl synthase N-terminal-like domain-containing protein [Citreicoccus inhibens]MBU8895224.1 hypothetical protein [Citreicoccus inhibens]